MWFLYDLKYIEKNYCKTFNYVHKVSPNVYIKFNVSEFKFLLILLRTSPLKVRWTKV